MAAVRRELRRLIEPAVDDKRATVLDEAGPILSR
jgi:hypothetical protein